MSQEQAAQKKFESVGYTPSHVANYFIFRAKEEKITEELLNFDECPEKTLYEGCYFVKKGLLPNKKLRKEIMKIVKHNKKLKFKRVNKQLLKWTSFTGVNFLPKYFILSSPLNIND